MNNYDRCYYYAQEFISSFPVPYPFGFGHVTCCGQWNTSGCDASHSEQPLEVGLRGLAQPCLVCRRAACHRPGLLLWPEPQEKMWDTNPEWAHNLEESRGQSTALMSCYEIGPETGGIRYVPLTLTSVPAQLPLISLFFANAESRWRTPLPAPCAIWQVTFLLPLLQNNARGFLPQ